MVEPYLERIGVSPPSLSEGPRSIEALAALQHSHLQEVPFETLSMRCDFGPITLDSEQLFEKMVIRRRGGTCYELNTLLARLLRRLGYPVAVVAARVWEKEPGRFGPPFQHLALIVDVNRVSHLVDVGFGVLSPDTPIDLTGEPDPGSQCSVIHRATCIDVWRHEDGRSTPMYRLEHQARSLDEFNEAIDWQFNSEDSRLARVLTAHIGVGATRRKLKGSVFKRWPLSDHQPRKIDIDGLLDHVRDQFSLRLPALPRLPLNLRHLAAPSRTADQIREDAGELIAPEPDRQ